MQSTGQTDRPTNAGQSDPYVPLCFAGDTKIIFMSWIKPDVFVKLLCPGKKKVPKKLSLVQRSSPQKAIFSAKVTVKVIRSSTLLSFESTLLVEHAYQIWILHLLWFKSYNKDKVDNRQRIKTTRPWSIDAGVYNEHKRSAHPHFPFNLAWRELIIIPLQVKFSKSDWIRILYTALNSPSLIFAL